MITGCQISYILVLLILIVFFGLVRLSLLSLLRCLWLDLWLGLLLGLLLLLLLSLCCTLRDLYLRVHLLDFRQIRVHEIAEQYLRIQSTPRVGEFDVRHPVYRTFFEKGETRPVVVNVRFEKVVGRIG